MPLSLFRNHTFAVTSAVGFVVGFALFGAITYLPLYFQITKGSSPTRSGLELTPLMAGLLVTSILSGQLISRFGRYKAFPVAGTAVLTVGMLLLTRVEVHTASSIAMLYAAIVGLGLGMVMQVLVLAVQNSVPFEVMGVATSGSTLFRQVGGSIGVSLFGTIFAARERSELTARLPAGIHVPRTTSPEVIRHLPVAARNAFVEAFSAALHPVFLLAAGISFVSFLLAWLIREAPLRTGSRAGEDGAAAGDGPQEPATAVEAA